MMDDEPDVEAARLRRPLPRVAEQPRLVVGRQGFRLADVNLRPTRAARAVSTTASNTFTPGTISSRTGRPSRSASATTAESSRRSSSVGARVAADRPARRRRRGGRSSRRRRDCRPRAAPRSGARATRGFRTGTSTLPGRASTRVRSASADGRSWNSSSASRRAVGMCRCRSLRNDQQPRQCGDQRTRRPSTPRRARAAGVRPGIAIAPAMSIKPTGHSRPPT